MRRNRLNARTRNAAIRAVQQHLVEFPAHVPVTEEQDRILRAVFAMCEQLTARHRLLPVPTDNALAQKYAISPRTVRNWRKAGCPFAAGQRRVLDWLAARRHAPGGAEVKFRHQLRNRRWKAKWSLSVMRTQIKAEVLGLRARYQGAGIAPPDWVRRMGFRAR